jgi:hypothetical protein
VGRMAEIRGTCEERFAAVAEGLSATLDTITA